MTITITVDQEEILNAEAECREGYTYSGYSGRCMYGDTCFGIVVRYRDDLQEILEAAGDFTEAFGAPRWDNMGLSYIAYWPSVTVDWED